MSTKPPQAYSIRAPASCAKVRTMRRRMLSARWRGVDRAVADAPAVQHAVVGGAAEVVEHEVGVAHRRADGTRLAASAASSGSLQAM
jgi:hypothetical protein